MPPSLWRRICHLHRATSTNETQSIANHARRRNVRSIIALSPICSKAEETAPKIGQISALHATDGFRAHGNLTPSVDDGSLQRKCFQVGVLNFALFNMEGKGCAGAEKVLLHARPEQLVGGMRATARLPRGQRLSQRHFRLLVWERGKQLHAAASTLYPRTRTPHLQDPSPVAPNCTHRTARHTRTRPAWIPSRSTSTATSTMSRASLSRRRSRRQSPSRP